MTYCDNNNCPLKENCSRFLKKKLVSSQTRTFQPQKVELPNGKEFLHCQFQKYLQIFIQLMSGLGMMGNQFSFKIFKNYYINTCI
jgi:hypothetical protein